MNQQEIIDVLSSLKPASMFLALREYRNESDELADHIICFHISYQNALVKSIVEVDKFIPTNDLWRQAKEEVLASLHSSLTKMEAVEELDDVYDRFFNSDGEYIKGIKIHRATQALHIYGLAHSKRIIIPGEYKKVNSRPLTIAKNKLRNLGVISRFRQFKITPENVGQINVGSLELIVDGEV